MQGVTNYGFADAKTAIAELKVVINPGSLQFVRHNIYGVLK
ncbi:MAG: hypothetical protein ACJAU1_000017 [Psychromonas sp.]|jgi:hypothetical protein